MASGALVADGFFMKSMKNRIFLILYLATLLVVSATGCRTAHGFGEDMQSAGEKIQDKTE
jgi:predicted small secreted protein